MKRLQEVITFFEEPRKTQVKGHGAKVYIVLLQNTKR